MQKDLDFFRKEYAKQKKLEKIVKSRVLLRPNVKKRQVAITFAILPFLFAATIILPILTDFDILIKIIFILTAIWIIFEIYFRFCLIILVKYYQRTAKEETRRRCKCIPSCSEYAIITLKKIFPLVWALIKIRKRLRITCNGEEYKIDFPIKKMGEDFESKLQ